MPALADFDQLFARAESLMRRWEMEEATALLESARDAGGFPNRLRHDLSVLYTQQGLFAEALAEIEAGMAAEPANRAIWHHFLALQKNNPKQPTPTEWRAMHLGFGEILRDTIDARHLDVPRAPAAGRRLRVGYLCPDTHLATERFVWPVLSHFDGAAFEVFAYWCHSEVTPELLATYPKVFHRSVRGATDEAVVTMIVADAIDILVDVAGHGAGNRLPVLCKRPAPVAMTWLDYLATTGLDTVDYRITDANADPAGAEAAHVERLLRLPGAQWCYRPPPMALREASLPPVREDVLFGSVSVPLKLSDMVLDMWGELLARVPRGRLRLLGVPEGRASERIRRRLALRGVDLARVEVRPRLEQAEFFREISDLDVVLDTHPFSGATSTLDALWQGVPVVTLAGALSHSRSTASILEALGQRAWIADTPGRYVEIAASLAVRAEERLSLRARLRESTLCDGASFARAMEGALRQGWEDSAQRPEQRPRDAMAAFWRELRAKAPGTAAARVALADIAHAVDLSREGGEKTIAGSDREWILLTNSSHFRAPAMSTMIPAALLARFDALAPLGAATLATGDIAAAGQGMVSGVSLIADTETGKIFASAWVPRGSWQCAVLAGGALLVRRALLSDVPLPRPASHAFAFHCDMIRLSHRLRIAGGRLGVSVALAAADRSWMLDAVERQTAMRSVEHDLGLPRWGQLLPSARPMKAAVSDSVWGTLLPGLEAVCDSGPLA